MNEELGFVGKALRGFAPHPTREVTSLDSQ